METNTHPENSSKKLSTKEANNWLLHNSVNPDYHMDEVDKMTGVAYNARVYKTKNGKEVLVQESNLGGFECLGSLLIFLMLTVAFGGALYNAITGYQNNDIPLAIQSGIIACVLLFADSWALNSLISDIQRKLEYKNAVKKGLIQKKKLTYGLIVSRFSVISFLCFFGYGLCGLLCGVFFNINIPPQGFIVLAIIFAISWVILCLSAVIGFIRGCINTWKERS